MFVVLPETNKPPAPADLTSTHHVAKTTVKATTTTQAPQDPERAAISSLASSLSADALPGDGALASALAATAAEPPGPDRESMAQQTISLAQVLLDGGGITNGQYQDVVNVLAPTGATPPTPDTTPVPGGIPGGGGPGQQHGHHGQGDQG